MKFHLRQIVGSILWWAEGTKSRKDKRWKKAVTYPVEITNTNPKIIQAFLNFLRKDIGIDVKKLKIQIQIHEDNDRIKCEIYWSEITNISLKRFN